VSEEVQRVKHPKRRKANLIWNNLHSNYLLQFVIEEILRVG